MMENYLPTMPFGKDFQIGNFRVIKISRVLSKKQINELRKESCVTKDTLRDVQRIGMPVIRVSAISGIWAVEFLPQSTMFHFLDTRDYEDKENCQGLHNLFISWFTDTMIMGDEQYISAKAKLMEEFIERQKATEDAQEEEKALDEVILISDAEEKIGEMAEEAIKEITEQKGNSKK